MTSSLRGSELEWVLHSEGASLTCTLPCTIACRGAQRIPIWFPRILRISTQERRGEKRREEERREDNCVERRWRKRRACLLRHWLHLLQQYDVVFYEDLHATWRVWRGLTRAGDQIPRSDVFSIFQSGMHSDKLWVDSGLTLGWLWVRVWCTPPWHRVVHEVKDVSERFDTPFFDIIFLKYFDIRLWRPVFLAGRRSSCCECKLFVDWSVSILFIKPRPLPEIFCSPWNDICKKFHFYSSSCHPADRHVKKHHRVSWNLRSDMPLDIWLWHC